MKESKKTFTLDVDTTDWKCPIGEKIGNRNIAEGKIPVLS